MEQPKEYCQWTDGTPNDLNEGKELMEDLKQEPEVNEGEEQESKAIIEDARQEPEVNEGLALAHEGESLPEQKDRIKRGRGALPKFKSAKELEKKVDEYFNKNRYLEVDKKTGTEKYVYVNPLTINGLSNYLGFYDREALLAYDEKNDFQPIIKKARAIIFQYIEDKMIDSKYPTAYIFWLKANANWRDTTPPSQDLNVNNAPVTITYNTPTNNKDNMEPIIINKEKSSRPQPQ